MAMTVEIDSATGATPIYSSALSAVTFGGSDVDVSTTAIVTPTSTGTNFSFVKSFKINITATGSLSMTNAKVGKVALESVTGTKMWSVTSHSTYTQATAAPTATGDNNVTAPTINSATAAALPLITSASAYAAGPFSTTGRVGNFVEIACGVDATNTSAGSQSICTLRWQWTES